MPTVGFSELITPAEAFARIGDVFCQRETAGTQLWRRLLERKGLPGFGRRQTVVLTGEKKANLLELAYCRRMLWRGESFYAVFLHDPDPEEMASAARRFWTGPEQSAASTTMAEIWDAFFLHVYLHELGHIDFALRCGWRLAIEGHEEAARDYSRQWLRRLLGQDLVRGSGQLVRMLSESG